MAGLSYTDFTLYRRLLRQARSFWPHVMAAFLVSLLSIPLALLAPLPLKIVVDSVIGSHPVPAFLDALLPEAARGSGAVLLGLSVGLLLAITVLSQLQDLGDTILRTYIGERLILDFRAQLFHHVQRLSLSYHDTQGTADATYRIQYDTQAIQTIAIDGLIPFVTAGFTVGGMIYVTAIIDWQLALIAMVISPVLFVVMWTYRDRLRRQSREVKRLESSTLSVLQEALAAMRLVKAFGQEDREEERFVLRATDGLRARIMLAIGEGSVGVLVGLITAVGTAAVLLVGIGHVQSGTLTLGELLLVMGYLSQLYAPLKTSSKRAAKLQSSLASAERAFSILDEAPEVVERPNATPIGRAAGAVVFRDVSFAYSHDRPVLHNISFQVEPGTCVGITGTTGAGKTTLVSLLTRFYDPTGGQILLDGIDLRDYRLSDLRNQFAIVLQEPVLFSTSIAENIAYARPGVGHDEIIAAAQAADAHEFITCLPEGYETQVGERGMRLSGGERQRISLARAFLKDAPILILDEPTSAVDRRTEATILKAIARLMHGRTTFLITHRLSALKHCDTQLVIERGRRENGSAPWWRAKGWLGHEGWGSRGPRRAIRWSKADA